MRGAVDPRADRAADHASTVSPATAQREHRPFAVGGADGRCIGKSGCLSRCGFARFSLAKCQRIPQRRGLARGIGQPGCIGQPGSIGQPAA